MTSERANQPLRSAVVERSSDSALRANKANLDVQADIHMKLQVCTIFEFALVVTWTAVVPFPSLGASTTTEPASWAIGKPIVTYWAGPPMTDATATQMAEGGWNLVWCTEKELGVAQRHGLRAQLQ